MEVLEPPCLMLGSPLATVNINGIASTTNNLEPDDEKILRKSN